MRTRYDLWVLSTALLLPLLNAQSVDEAKLVGKWKMNISKSQFQGAPRPIDSKMEISHATAARFKWTVATTFSGGKTSFMGFDGAIDGKPYMYQGAGSDTRLSFVDKQGTLEGTATYPGQGTMHQSITISPDGNTMTVQCTLMLQSSNAAWTEIWERIPQKKHK